MDKVSEEAVSPSKVTWDGMVVEEEATDAAWANLSLRARVADL